MSSQIMSAEARTSRDRLAATSLPVSIRQLGLDNVDEWEDLSRNYQQDSYSEMDEESDTD
jgi:hypothetical protein